MKLSSVLSRPYQNFFNSLFQCLHFCMDLLMVPTICRYLTFLFTFYFLLITAFLCVLHNILSFQAIQLVCLLLLFMVASFEDQFILCISSYSREGLSIWAFPIILMFLSWLTGRGCYKCQPWKWDKIPKDGIPTSNSLPFGRRSKKQTCILKVYFVPPLSGTLK